MYWAYKKTDGHITVQTYQDINQIKTAYTDYTITKIILPFKANDIKEAAIQAGNRFESSGRFLLMEIQNNGLEIPRRYER